MIYYRVLPYLSIYTYYRMQGYKFIATDEEGNILQPETFLKASDLTNNHKHYKSAQKTNNS